MSHMYDLAMAVLIVGFCGGKEELRWDFHSIEDYSSYGGARNLTTDDIYNAAPIVKVSRNLRSESVPTTPCRPATKR